MPRRMAYYDYTHPALQPQAWTVTASTIGGLLLVISAVLLVFILATATKRVAQRLSPSPSACRCIRAARRLWRSTASGCGSR